MAEGDSYLLGGQNMCIKIWVLPFLPGLRYQQVEDGPLCPHSKEGVRAVYRITVFVEWWTDRENNPRGIDHCLPQPLKLQSICEICSEYIFFCLSASINLN